MRTSQHLTLPLFKTIKMNGHLGGFVNWFKNHNEQPQSLPLFKTSKMNGHFLGFYYLFQKLQWITPITTLHRQNDWSFWEFSPTGLKIETTKPNNFYPSRQAKRMVILWVFSSTGLKARTNNTNHFNIIFKSKMNGQDITF